MREYKLKDFDYKLPKELIAQTPASPRESARLLVYERSSGKITDDYFYNLHQYLSADTTLVLNNSKVEKARLLFGKTEVFLLNTLSSDAATALVRPGRKFKHGAEVELAKGITAEVTNVDESGLRTLKFNTPLSSPVYDKFRQTPFPPYIAPDETLSHEYQTVYARPLGSKAAPTAGLHFSEDYLRQIKDDFPVAEVTLHVGLGTFAPVKTDDIAKHKMHSEWYEISKNAAAILNRAAHITAVGTTSVRVLEAAVSKGRRFSPASGWTDIFIMPGYKFGAVDALITNFHLPKSTLLMLVSAFAGFNETRRLYKHAIEQKYRFYSFGDAMLII